MALNFNATTPAAPATFTNVSWQVDASGNVSANVPTSPQIVSTVDATAQAANIAATDLVSSANVVAGIYRVAVYIMETQAASSSSTLPSVVISWTDKDNNTAQSVTITAASPTGNSLTTFAQSQIILDAKAAVAIQYATTSYASSGGTPMQYALHLRASKLG